MRRSNTPEYRDDDSISGTTFSNKPILKRMPLIKKTRKTILTNKSFRFLYFRKLASEMIKSPSEKIVINALSRML
jgi:hypothetical protein